MHQFVLPNADRARTALILLCITLAASLLPIGLDFYVAYSGKVPTADDMRTAFSQQMLLTIVGVSMLLAISRVAFIVLFIMWFRRAYHNLHKAQVTGLSYSEGWAAGAWFVPFLCWIWPYQIMQDIYTATPRAIGGEERRVSPLLPVWWACWLIASFAGTAGQFMLNTRYESAATASAWGGVLQLLAGIFLFFIIRQISRDETDFYRRWQQELYTQQQYQQAFNPPNSNPQ